jgi:surface antigen
MPSPARPSGAPLGSSIHPSTSTSASTSAATSAADAATNTLSQYAKDAKPYHSPNSYPWGQCTWGAAALAHDNVDHLGDALYWLANAQAGGLPTGSVPKVGATVVFQPGVQGASDLGHVAHVIAVYPDGAFRVEELNFYGYGGGFGVWSTRVAHTGWGVSFIY